MRLPSIALVLVLVGCSDDGVAANGSATDSDNDVTGGMSTTAMTSLSSGGDTLPMTTGATTEPGTTSNDDDSTSMPGSESTFTPTESGDATSSGSGSGTESGSGSGTESSSGSSGSSDSSGSSSSSGPGDGNVGADCEVDADCDSDVCWDWNDYDPLCFGAVCSVTCMGDDECVEAFTNAGVPFPENVYCGDDNLCVPLESGVGGWACA